MNSGSLVSVSLLRVMVPVLWLAVLGSCVEGEVKDKPQVKLTGAAHGRNLILLTVDTLRADRLGAYGYSERENSPAIDALLDRGMRFSEAAAPRSQTYPSLASVMTGLYPSGHHLIRNGSYYTEAQATLARVLAAEGYETAAFLANMCYAHHRGFDELRCVRRRDSLLVEEAMAWLDQSDRKRPIFLWIHLHGAHSPYLNGGGRALQEFDPDYIGRVTTNREKLTKLQAKQIPLNQRDIRHLNAIYDAAVQGTDELVNRIIKGLERRKILRNGVLVFLADHGEELYEHNQFIFHSCSVYQSGLHVPLGIIAEGLVDPGRVDLTVELIDVAPTLLDFLGLPAMAESHGTSLVPYLEGSAADEPIKAQYSEYEDTLLRTVRLGDWKLVDNPEEYQPFCLPGAPANHYPLDKFELYNLATDPKEQINLASEEPQIVEELHNMITERFADSKRQDNHQDNRQKLSEEMKEQLRSMGYIAY
jgi:choline-sulfatase